MYKFLLLIPFVMLFSCQQGSDTQSVSKQDQDKFNQYVETWRTFVAGFIAEDLDSQMELFADDVKWSQPVYNGNQISGKADIRAVIESWQKDFQVTSFAEAEGLIGNDENPNPAGFYSGSYFSTGTPSSSPNGLRVYGTWYWTHTETGIEGGNKWYGILTFNEEGKINSFTDWFDAGGVQDQIEKALEN